MDIEQVNQIEIPAEVAVPEQTAQVDGQINNEVVEDKQEAISPTQKRFNRMTAKLAEKEQEIEFLKSLAFKDKDAESAQPVTPAVQNNQVGKPQLADYESIEDYTEAVTEWKLEQKLQAREAQKSVNRVQQAFDTRVAEFQKTVPDYQEAVKDILPFVNDPELVQLALESEVGPEMLYQLANNDAELDRFAKMSKARKLAYLANQETAIINRKSVSKTVAPAPITKVTANSASEKSSNEQSYAEWKAAREAQINARKRR